MPIFLKQHILEVDIEKYPTHFEPHKGSLTIGDLHANPVKLMYSLLRHGVLKFKNEETAAEDYDDFVKLYHDSNNITTYEFEGERPYSYADLIFQISDAENKLQNAINGNKYRPSFKELLSGIGIEIDEINDKTDLNNLREQIKETQTNIETQLKAIIHSSDEEQIKKLTAEQKNAKNALNRIDEFEEQLNRLNKYKSGAENLKQKIIAEFPPIKDKFNNFLSKLEVKDKGLLRLIGDELADRGHNDFFMLRLMQFLHGKDINFNVTISNHSNEFVTYFESLNGTGEQSKIVTDDESPSIASLKALIDAGIISIEELDTIVKDIYFPSLKAIDYQIIKGEPPKIRLFTHAPVRFDTIEKIANTFGIDYQDSDVYALAATIDAINARVQKELKKGTLNAFLKLEEGVRPDKMLSEEVEETPLLYLIWNRWDEDKDRDDTARPDKKEGESAYDIEYYHGHDTFISNSPHIFNTDNSIGKKSSTAEDITNYQNRCTTLKNPSLSEKDKKMYTDVVKGFDYTVFLSEYKPLSFWDKYAFTRGIKNFFMNLFGSKKEKTELPEIQRVGIDPLAPPAYEAPIGEHQIENAVSSEHAWQHGGHPAQNPVETPEMQLEATSSQTGATNLKSGSDKMEKNTWAKATPIHPHVSDSAETPPPTTGEVKAQLHHFKKSQETASETTPLIPPFKP